MTQVLVYDDTAEMLERVAAKYDTTVAEVLDMMLISEQDLDDSMQED